MYKVKIKEREFMCPKESLVGFALLKALDKGIERGPIHNEETAKAFLEGMGYVIDVAD